MRLVPEGLGSSGFEMRSASEPPVGGSSVGCSEDMMRRVAEATIGER